MIDFNANPFFLKKEEIDWVNQTYEKMTLRERIGQLFCPILFTKDEKELAAFLKKYAPGGILYRECSGQELLKAHRFLQEKSKIPLLTASNLETGGNGSASEATYFGRQMLVAASGKSECARDYAKVCCSEGRALGVNWAFAPVCDIDRNYHNPIINVRSFGNNPDTVCKMSLEYLKVAKEEGIACAPKHFPGDGIDERDQHLLTSVNSLSREEWDSTYGKIYQTLINEGTLTIMAGHIALPCYESQKDKIVPATLSKALLKNLLREKLHFNGLIVTDATPMVGFCSAMERKKSVPLAIENGCDMFLFNKNIEEDYMYMQEGIKSGLLSQERFEDAVKRILAVKAALKLNQKEKLHPQLSEKEALNILSSADHVQKAEKCADLGITLVKNKQKILPLNPVKHKRVLLEILGDFESNGRVINTFIQELSACGFEVTVYQKEGFEVLEDSVENFKSKYDLVLYAANIETASNRTTARINWHTMFGLGNNIPWMVEEVPVIFISLGNPYHLLDAPMVKTYINCYCNSDFVIKAVIKKLLGKSEFKGLSPVDAFCGRKDLEV